MIKSLETGYKSVVKASFILCGRFALFFEYGLTFRRDFFSLRTFELKSPSVPNVDDFRINENWIHVEGYL
jgi:hypothetical protein